MDSKPINNQNNTNNTNNNNNAIKSQPNQQQTPEYNKSKGLNNNNNQQKVTFNEKNNELNRKTSAKNEIIKSNSKPQQRRPVRLEPLNHAQSADSNQSANQKPQRIKNKRTVSNLSSDSTQKKILRWHLWWDGSQSNLRVPSFPLPNRNVPSRIYSLENINHKPGKFFFNLDNHLKFLTISSKKRWRKRSIIK